MTKRVLSAALLGCSALGGLAPPARAANPSLLGKWYGLREGSAITVEFRKDGTVSVQDAANSNGTFTCRYRADYRATPLTLDLTGIHPEGFNLDCAAIAEFRGEREVEIFGTMGPHGQAQRPKQIQRNAASYYALYLKLSRDPRAAQPPTPPPAPAAASLAFARNKRLGRGFNLSDVLDQEEVQPMAPARFRTIRAAGFSNLRLPVRWTAHSGSEAPYAIDPRFFREVDRIVRQSLDSDLAVVIDVHYYPLINMPPGSAPRDARRESFDASVKRFYALWEQIAEHYKGYPPQVYFEILNEPNRELGAERWNELVARTLKIIRKTNPGRTVVVGTPNLGQSWTLGLLKLPRDDWNLIVDIHYYTPATFTHQGASWVPGSSAWRGTKWTGTREEKAAIESELRYAAAWSKRNHRPIYVGEFGAIEEADLASRARWIAFVRQTAEKYGMSSALWSFFRSPFSAFDDQEGRWIEPLRDALAPPR